MLPLGARVKNGRLVIDEPTTLPDGTEVEFALIEDELDEAERAKLNAALDDPDDELRAGKGLPGSTVIAGLRNGL